MTRPCVLVFSGSDPGGGAGLQADLQAIAGQGAHALTVVTAVTVQDNDRVYAVNPVSPELVRHQSQVLIDKMPIAAVKIGIPGSVANAQTIAGLLAMLRQRQPELPVVLDTVLASGKGNALSNGDPLQGLRALMPWATLLTPNLPEAARMCEGEQDLERQAARLHEQCPNVLIKGGHADGEQVVNRWYARSHHQQWVWPRLSGTFHGTGCTLASAIAGQLACGASLKEAIEVAQAYVHESLLRAYAIAAGQRIPNRNH